MFIIIYCEGYYILNSFIQFLDTVYCSLKLREFGLLAVLRNNMEVTQQ